MKTHVLISSILLFISLLSNSSAFPSKFFPNITYFDDDDHSRFSNFTSPAWESFKNFTGCHLGEQREGFAELKQYFKKFGYIPEDYSNFTDEFDNSFESALKIYQQNFHLNPTGVLDESTMNQIQRPRCGVADIINGSSSMNSGKSSNSHLHTVAHFSFFPGRPRWTPSNRKLSYAFAKENQLTDIVKSVFSRAFDRWAEVTPLTFIEVERYSDADITIGFFGGDHGDGEPFDGTLGTLAHAFSPPNGRLHLDREENWVVDGDVSTSGLSSAVDLESVAVHEIGHLLGLGHSSVEESIMYPTISSRRKKVDLASDDVEGVQMLYGSNPNYNGTSTTSYTRSNQERDTTSSSNGVHLLIISGLWVHSILMVLTALLLLL